jgi:uncharacterized membrane protein YphA (DoxX/SURF4 family)
MLYQDSEIAGEADPRWVDRILDWPWTWLVTRVALTAPFVVSGVIKLCDIHAAALEQESVGLHPGLPWALLTICVELFGPLLIIATRFVWLGAGMLGVFTGLAALLAHHFWNLTGAARIAEMNAFFEHVSMIAGFILVALVAEHGRRLGDISPFTRPRPMPREGRDEAEVRERAS